MEARSAALRIREQRLTVSDWSSPVPEIVSGEEGFRLQDVELEQDLQQVQSQKRPLGVSDERVLLIQADEDGIHHDDQVIHGGEGPGTHTVLMRSLLGTCGGFPSCPAGSPMLDQAAQEAAGGGQVEGGADPEEGVWPRLKGDDLNVQEVD